jgi:hypothetical protein
MDYHTPSGSYGMSRTSLCTESETDPNKMCPDSRSLQRLDLQSDVKPIDDARRGLRQRFWQSFDDLVAIRDREAELPLRQAVNSFSITISAVSGPPHSSTPSIVIFQRIARPPWSRPFLHRTSLTVAATQLIYRPPQ